MKDNNTQFDSIAREYDEVLKKNLGTADIEKFAEYKIELLKKILKENEINSILDFGCGTGRSFPYLRKHFPISTLYGCDVSTESLKVAAEIIPDENLFVNGSADEIKRFGKHYDLIIATCVFHHISPEERLLWIKACFENLSQNGFFAIFEHNMKNPFTKKIVTRAEEDNVDWMIRKNFLEGLMTKAAGINGRLYWSGYTLFSPIRFPGILSVEQLLKNIPLGAQYCTIIQKQQVTS